MICFSGIVQLDSIEEYKKTIGNKVQIKINGICSRGSSIPYDGESPFDIYPIFIEAPATYEAKLDMFEQGQLIYIESGNIVTWPKQLPNTCIWNCMLVVQIDKIRILGKLPTKSYTEHLRLYKNSQRCV